MELDMPNADASTEDFEFQALGEAVNYRRALQQEFAPYLAGPVIEVGAGIGQFTTELAATPTITRLIAVEPDDGFVKGFRVTHPQRELIHGTAAQVPSDEAWRALVSVNVLEHIRDDAAELRVWHRLLAPQQGHLCLFVPARPELYAPIDRDFGHFRRYTKPGLQRLVQEAGYEIVRLHYFNLVGYFAWGLNFVLLARRRFDPAAVRLFDRALFPWSHALERSVLRPPFGQSLLAIARARR